MVMFKVSQMELQCSQIRIISYFQVYCKRSDTKCNQVMYEALSTADVACDAVKVWYRMLKNNYYDIHEADRIGRSADAYEDRLRKRLEEYLYSIT